MYKLLKFMHGLGDLIMFQIVLRHLKTYRPDDDYTIEVCRGRESALAGYGYDVYGLEMPFT